MNVVVGEVKSPDGSCADIGLARDHALLLLRLRQTAIRLRCTLTDVLLDRVGLLPLLLCGPRCCKQAHQMLLPASNSCGALEH